MTENDGPPPLLVRVCSDKAAFEAIPRRRVFFDMKLVRRLFEASRNFQVLVYTPYIIFVKSRAGREVTLSEDGRMLLKKTLNKDEATALAYTVLETVLKAIRPR